MLIASDKKVVANHLLESHRFEWANQMYTMIISFYLSRFPEYRKTNDIRAFFAKTQAP